MYKLTGMVTALLLMAACASQYPAYRRDIREGLGYLRHEEYVQAKASFLKAIEIEKNAQALALAATADYRMNNLAEAEKYISEADKLEHKDFSFLRITGFKALIFLKQGKKPEGMAALKEYIDEYGHQYPLQSIEQVKRMWESDQIDMPKLEYLINIQVSTYEADIEEYRREGTGWYARDIGRSSAK